MTRKTKSKTPRVSKLMQPPKIPIPVFQECKNCRELNPVDNRYCFACGEEMIHHRELQAKTPSSTFACKRCGKGLEEKEVFCTRCGEWRGKKEHDKIP